MRVLFLPLGNGVGHVTRALALAEEFHSNGHQVTVATNWKYTYLRDSVSSGIEVITTEGIEDRLLSGWGRIHHYGDDIKSNLENIRLATPFDAHQFEGVISKDLDLVERIGPDVIISDYRFSATELHRRYGAAKVFNVSHTLGYPVYHESVTGRLPPPLDVGTLLVAGIRELEYPRFPRRGRQLVLRSYCRVLESMKRHKKVFCGPMFWNGWKNLDRSQPRHADILLFLGGMGVNEELAVPRIMEALAGRYSVNCVSPYWYENQGNVSGDVIQYACIDTYLGYSRILVCHGGHATVLKAILQRVPLVIIPNNLDQLAIGRQIEEKNLGVMISKPLQSITSDDLSLAIESIDNNSNIGRSIRHYSTLLAQSSNGAESAMKHIVKATNGR